MYTNPRLGDDAAADHLAASTKSFERTSANGVFVTPKSRPGGESEGHSRPPDSNFPA